MKKIYFVLFCVMSIALVGCNKSLNYKEACQQGDYDKAYKMAEDLMDEAQPYHAKYASANGTRYDWALEAQDEYLKLASQAEEIERYTVLHEATKVLEEQGEAGLTKIAFIVKEHDAEWVYKDLIDIAISMGNDDLTNRLKKLAGHDTEEKSED